MMRPLTLFILSILIWPSLLWSQDDAMNPKPGLTASIDRNTVRVGSIVVLSIGYRLPEGASLPADPEIKGLEDMSVMDFQVEPDKIRIRVLIDKLDSWKTGPISLSYLEKEGNTRTLATDPISLTILSSLGEDAEEAQLKPIQGIIPTRNLILTYLYLAAGLFGASIITVLALMWWYKKGRPDEVSVIIPEDPPHVLAKREIEELNARMLFEKGHFKAFYFRFSEILRRYLEALRGFPAAEFTTEEIAACIREEQDRMLLPMLQQADLVKFADTIPTPDRKEQEVRWALTYIRETVPDPEAGNLTDGLKGVAQ
ncbi:MAG: hypothetical protein JRJ65_06205 [Deltaproteobacteria bacterium]|nr:hypothetical protein [Deltaproteobacteria bacterium]